MLKNIPEILSPELLMRLSEMGHGDKLVICDGNFPTESVGKNSYVVRCDGHGTIELLEAILKFFPLDTYSVYPVNLMEKVSGDETPTPIWNNYKKLVADNDPRGDEIVGFIERQKFYKVASKAYLLIATSEKALYANVMLTKGVI